MLIDVHAHIYPDNIAMRAARSIGEFYYLPVAGNGTLNQLLEWGERAGIDRHVVHSAAITPSRVASVNRFISETVANYPKKLIGFGSCHPDDPELEKVLDSLPGLGLRGVKLHPDLQSYYPDDPNAIRMFEMLRERNLPAIIHIGDDRLPYSAPDAMRRALDKVPGVRVICAHLGGCSIWDEGWRHLAGLENVWTDCSSSLYALSESDAVRIIRRFGADRVCFGTDFPVWKPVDELIRLRNLPLTGDELEWITHKSFEAFIGEENL